MFGPLPTPADTYHISSLIICSFLHELEAELEELDEQDIRVEAFKPWLGQLLDATVDNHVRPVKCTDFGCIFFFLTKSAPGAAKFAKFHPTVHHCHLTDLPATHAAL